MKWILAVLDIIIGILYMFNIFDITGSEQFLIGLLFIYIAFLLAIGDDY